MAKKKTPTVAVLMGSDSDWPVLEHAVTTLAGLVLNMKYT